MKINLLTKNIELTDSIRDYVYKKITNLERIVESMDPEGEARITFEVGKNSERHKSGEIFHADCVVKISGRDFYSSADERELFLAIDTVRESLFKEISREKDKKLTLFKRGAKSIKKMMKGLTKRNPLTGKY
ncbi:MAG: ribosome-associated translation inhibitor RaiA [Candidatus Paceibacterota bacterium]|jgi:putative sigma-54 modulation protein